MKHMFLAVAVLLTAGWSVAQTDPLNLQKYWKLRNDFREKFVKIGPNAGESITVRALKPLECVDNYTADGTNANMTPQGNAAHGEIHWGDGMIRHGYYLGLLATEYRLLKDANQDVTGVKNELFYALNAINRLDYLAEKEQGEAYDVNFAPSLNGFYMREDIPEDFAFNNWGNSKLEARCVNSAHYNTNNAAKLNQSTPYGPWYANGNSYQNSPSNDQLSSLMLGFSLIHKLVDTNEFVQPPGSEFGFYLVGETQAIVHRMMSYLEDHNWTIIDVNGWPVNNGGGDLSWANYPLSIAATRITGQTYNTFWRRRLSYFAIGNVQYCITGYGLGGNTPEGRDDACDAIIDPVQSGAYDELVLGGIPGPANNQNFSIFQEWSDDGFGTIGKPIGFSEDTWTGVIQDFIEDVTDDRKISNFSFPFNTVQYFIDGTENDQSATTIISNYGVASGLWTGQTLSGLTELTGNVQLELINAIIRNEAAPNIKSYYQQYLNGMSMIGPYNMTAGDASLAISKPAENGWGAEHRWTWTSDADGGQNSKGIFNGLDYMLFHNLFYLKFGTGLPKYQSVNDCFCEQTPQISTVLPDPNPFPGVTQQEYFGTANSVNEKLEFLSVCTEDVFSPLNNNVTTTFNVQPYFPNYVDMAIFTGKLQKENATISSTGDVNVRTLFKICSAKTLTIQAGGRMDIEKATTTVGYNSKIDNSGDVVVKSGTTLTVEALGKLILRPGSKLIIEANAKVIIENGAIIEYFGGASIIMHEPTSQLRLGSTIKVMDGGEFTITHTGSSAGKLIITSPSASFLTATANVGKFKLVGKGITDPLIILEPNTKLWAMNDFAQSLTIQQCKIELGAGATLQCDQPFFASSVEFNATATNGGLTLAEGSLMNSSRFINVPLFAKMNIENKGTLEMYNCYLLADNPALNPSNQALVEVTGRGYKIGSCNFYTTKNYGLYSTNLALASTIGGGSVQYYGTLPASHLLTGIYDNSTAEVSVNSVTITKCNTGIRKQANKLSLRCNTFIDNKDVNVFAGSSSTLNMRAATLGGYNKLYKTTNNKNIYLGGCYLADIKTGYNYIEYTGVANTTIVGATNSNCNTCPTLDFSGNQWNATNKSPINIASVYNANGLVQFAYTTSPTALWQTCPSSNVPTSPGDPNAKSLVAEDGMPIIYSSIVGDSTRLDELVYRASEKMSIYNDSTANDLEAIDLLNEVFTADLDKTDSITNNWSWFAFDQMKAALESAFANDQLVIADNSSSFDPYVTKYAHAVMVMSDSVIDGNNYERQFIHEINKAHLMRVIGHSEIGFNILTQLEACGLDSAEQAHLNYWKQEFEKDLVIEEIGFAAIDSVIVIDTISYLNPALVVNAYSFGAIIHDLNDIQYPNCSFFAHRDKKIGFGSLQVFPNPASDEVRISLNHPMMEGEGILQIQQADGRTVLTKKINTNESTGINMRVSEWKPGVYQIKYRSPKGVVSTAQLVVQ